MLLIGLIGAVIMTFSLIFAGTSTGFITYADYLERSVKNLVSIIAVMPNLTDVQLPMGCKYLVLDKNYQIVKTSLENEELNWAMDYAISGKINSNLNKQYVFITRENEYEFFNIILTRSLQANSFMSISFRRTSVICPHRNKLYYSLRDINGKVCKNLTGTSLATF